jgi:hypothetical protein
MLVERTGNLRYPRLLQIVALCALLGLFVPGAVGQQVRQPTAADIADLQEAAAMGRPGAKIAMGAQYISGEFIPQNMQKGEQLLLEALIENPGDDLTVMLGSAGMAVRWIAVDPFRAHVWLRLASIQATESNLTTEKEELAQLIDTTAQAMNGSARLEAGLVADTWAILFDRGLPDVKINNLRTLDPPQSYVIQAKKEARLRPINATLCLAFSSKTVPAGLKKVGDYKKRSRQGIYTFYWVYTPHFRIQFLTESKKRPGKFDIDHMTLHAAGGGFFETKLLVKQWIVSTGLNYGEIPGIVYGYTGPKRPPVIGLDMGANVNFLEQELRKLKSEVDVFASLPVISGNYMDPQLNGSYNQVKVHWKNSASARQVFCN